MSAILATDLACCYRVASALAALETPQLAAVFVGGVGTDWERAPAYPYAVIRPESAEQPRGGVTRTIRVRYVSRIADTRAAAKPTPITPTPMPPAGSSPVYMLAGFDQLATDVQPIRDALSTAALGAPLESIATEYDTDSQFPVQSAILTLSLADAQAFGDSF